MPASLQTNPTTKLPLNQRLKLYLIPILLIIVFIEIHQGRDSTPAPAGDYDYHDHLTIYKVYQGIGNMLLSLWCFYGCLVVFMVFDVDVFDCFAGPADGERRGSDDDSGGECGVYANINDSGSVGGGDKDDEDGSGDDSEGDEDDNEEGIELTILPDNDKDTDDDKDETGITDEANEEINTNQTLLLLPPQSDSDPNSKLNTRTLHLLNTTTTLTLSYLINAILYLHFDSTFPHFHIFPILLLIQISYVGLHVQDREYVREGLRLLIVTLKAPFKPSTFRDIVVGDVLTSLVRVMLDVVCIFGFVFTVVWGVWNVVAHGVYTTDITTSESPIHIHIQSALIKSITLAPLISRFNQTLRKVYEDKLRFPTLLNSLKYFTAAMISVMSVTDKGESMFFWIFAVVGTVYMVYWDVVMDWDLIYISHVSTSKFNKTRNHGPVIITIKGYNIHLRRNRIYTSDKFYVTVLVLNVVLRFIVTLSILPLTSLTSVSFLQDYIASLEILRRFLWVLVRVENEHLRIHPPPLVLGDDKEDLEFVSEGNEYEGFIPIPFHRQGSGSNLNLNLSEGIKPFSCNFEEMKDMTNSEIVRELVGYAVLFLGLVGVAGMF